MIWAGKGRVMNVANCSSEVMNVCQRFQLEPNDVLLMMSFTIYMLKKINGAAEDDEPTDEDLVEAIIFNLNQIREKVAAGDLELSVMAYDASACHGGSDTFQ